MLEADSNTDPLKYMPFGQNQRRGGKFRLPRSHSRNRAGWKGNEIRRVIDHLHLCGLREQMERIRLGQLFSALLRPSSAPQPRKAVTARPSLPKGVRSYFDPFRSRIHARDLPDSGLFCGKRFGPSPCDASILTGTARGSDRRRGQETTMSRRRRRLKDPFFQARDVIISS